MDNRYKCTRSNLKGYISDCFFVTDSSAKEVYDYLNIWQWQGSGTWEVELVEENIDVTGRQAEIDLEE